MRRMSVTRLRRYVLFWLVEDYVDNYYNKNLLPLGSRITKVSIRNDMMAELEPLLRGIIEVLEKPREGLNDY